MAVDPDEFKRALRSWPSGVTVVTTQHDAQFHGMTVSAFSSVSLEPPLVAVCLAEGALSFELLKQSGVFAVNVLAQGQDGVSNHFASRSTHDARFEGQDYALGENGCPLLAGAVAALECSVSSLVPAGDHQLVIGQVQRAVLGEGPPLLYWDGGYRQL